MGLLVRIYREDADAPLRIGATIQDGDRLTPTQCSCEVPPDLVADAERALAEVGPEPFIAESAPLTIRLFRVVDRFLDEVAEDLGWGPQGFVRDQMRAYDLDSSQVAERLGVTVATVHRMLTRARTRRAAGEPAERPWLSLPDPAGYVGRSPYWHRHDIDAFLEDAPHRAKQAGRPRRTAVTRPA